MSLVMMKFLLASLSNEIVPNLFKVSGLRVVQVFHLCGYGESHGGG